MDYRLNKTDMTRELGMTREKARTCDMLGRNTLERFENGVRIIRYWHTDIIKMDLLGSGSTEIDTGGFNTTSTFARLRKFVTEYRWDNIKFRYNKKDGAYVLKGKTKIRFDRRLTIDCFGQVTSDITTH